MSSTDKTQNESSAQVVPTGDALATSSKKLARYILEHKSTPVSDLVGHLDSDDPLAADAHDLLQLLANRPKRNTSVKRGEGASDVLGLRSLEHVQSSVFRGMGSTEDRLQALKDKYFGGDQDVTREMVLDDSWEDKTGLVKVRAKKFPNRARRHDPSVLPPQHNALRPLLPLLYTRHGHPAPPSRPFFKTQADVKAHMNRCVADCKELDGKYQLSVAEGLVLRQTGLPSWKGALPQVGQEILDSFAANKSNHHFKVVGYTSGRKGRQNPQYHIDNGHYSITRATNLGEFSPDVFAMSFKYFTWAEVLGEHVGSLFEHDTNGQTLAKKMFPASGASSAGKTPASTTAAASAFKISFLDDQTEDDLMVEATEYCEQLIKTRFEQFIEYLDRPKERRECSMCKKPGAECVLLPPGDYDTIGVEWADPVCWHMTCRRCITEHMIRCDLSGPQSNNADIAKQRCNCCTMPYGGFHIHDAGTKKLMLMQAAKQMLFFWLPRKESEPAYTMAENARRFACIKSVITHGLLPALQIKVPKNRATEAHLVVGHGQCSSSCWLCWLDPTGESGNGYNGTALDGRLFLALCEAEAQLENYEQAEAYARRAVELLSALPRGSVKRESQPYSKMSHPARQLCIPARQIAKKMAACVAAKQKRQVLQLTDTVSQNTEGGHQTHKKSHRKKKKKNRGGKKKKKK